MDPSAACFDACLGSGVDTRSSHSTVDMDPSAAVAASAAVSNSSAENRSTYRKESLAGSDTDEETLKQISAYAKKWVGDSFRGSSFFSLDSIENIPKFARGEIKTGKILGRGQFCIVREVKAIDLVDDEMATAERGLSHAEDGASRMQKQHQVRTRKFIAEHCMRNGKDARYALKALSAANLSDPNLFFRATQDLALEVHMLSSIEHPHIVKIWGLSCNDLCTKADLLLMDRLYDTLDQRMHKWKKVDKRTRWAKGKLFDSKGKKRQQLLDDRLTVAFDLAGALKYLHSWKIMHRDIKPENIGFDVLNDVKIIDFGFARELRDEDKVEKESRLYNLTGMRGSMRYMAPEVYRKKPYNDRADIYSFGILLWEILALSRPFADYSMDMIKDRVLENGVRPKVAEEWSARIQELLRSCWSPTIIDRPSSGNVTELLKEELVSIRMGDGPDDVHTMRRPTDVSSSKIKSAAAAGAPSLPCITCRQ